MNALRSSWSRRILMLVTVLGLAVIAQGGEGPAFAASPAQAHAASVERARSSSGAVSTWRILLLIFRQTDTDYVDSSGATRRLQATLPQSDADALVAAFRGSLPAAVRQWSNNQAAWDVEVQYPSDPITRVASVNGDSQWVDPSCIPEALGQYFRPGYHDVVMVYWRSSDNAGNSIPALGWGYGSLQSDPSYGYITVTYPGRTLWDATEAEMLTQVWIHEWLHSVCFFYEGLGYRLPTNGPDGATTHGYSAEQSPYPGWGTYYSDIMNNLVPENGLMTGIPAAAWARATIRGPNVDPPPPSLTVTAPTGTSSYAVGDNLTVSWTTSGAAASGEFGVWARSAAGGWYIGKLVTASGGTSFSTGVTLDVPAGSGYQAIVGYRPTAGSGAWSSWGTSPGSFTVMGTGISLTVTAPTGTGSYAAGDILTVSWTTGLAVYGGEFGVWARNPDGWYIAKIVAAAGLALYSTPLTLDVPAGSGYQAIVAYRPTTGSGAWSTWGTSPGSFTVTAR